jgi:hypothetical protein
VSTKNGRLRWCAVSTVTSAVVIAGLAIASAPAYAQTGDPPPPEPSDGQFVTGTTVLGEAVAVKQSTATTSSTASTVTVRNSAPMVHDVAPYTIKDVPGTFTKKVEFYQGNEPSAQNVLAADSSGKALDPSRVRVAYYTTSGQYWVFYPGTGTLERVEAWPRAYPSQNLAIHQLTSLFGGPGGPEWLETVRQIAVGAAAAVILGGAVYAFLPGAIAAAATTVPLAW